MTRQEYRRIISVFNPSDGLKNRISEKLQFYNMDDCKAKFRKRAVAAIVLTISFTALLIFGISINNNKVCGFTLTAYAAKNPKSMLTSTYKTDTVPTILKPDIKVNLPEYSPLTSAVPGIPFTVNLKSGDSDNIKIKVSADKGSILLWNQTNYIVTDKGKNCILNSNDTFYWSPLSSNNISKGITSITVTVLAKGKEISKKEVLIYNTDTSEYAVKLKNS